MSFEFEYSIKFVGSIFLHKSHDPQQTQRSKKKKQTMDCTLPGHAVRPFCAAITCLSRVGKDLYLSFDPIEGLTLRSLNDAKSVFCVFQYEPSFFQRCTGGPTAVGRKRSQSQDDQISVRVMVKALATVVRPRKNVVSLRVFTSNYSMNTGNEGNSAAAGETTANNGRRRAQITQSQPTTASSQTVLSFEFTICHELTNTVFTVVHRVGMEDAQTVSAVANMDNSSEIVASSSTLLRLLEPLKRTQEVALIVNDAYKLLTATNFHPSDLLSATMEAASPTSNASGLKTETSLKFSDLDDVEFVAPTTDEDEEDDGGIPPPDDASEHVAIVFTKREFHAFLQFCAHAEHELRVCLNFFWGGRPLVMETKNTGMAHGFSARLVMATLDHQLLGDFASAPPVAAAGMETSGRVATSRTVAS